MSYPTGMPVLVLLADLTMVTDLDSPATQDFPPRDFQWD